MDVPRRNSGDNQPETQELSVCHHEQEPQRQSDHNALSGWHIHTHNNDQGSAPVFDDNGMAQVTLAGASIGDVDVGSNEIGTVEGSRVARHSHDHGGGMDTLALGESFSSNSDPTSLSVTADQSDRVFPIKSMVSVGLSEWPPSTGDIESPSTASECVPSTPQCYSRRQQAGNTRGNSGTSGDMTLPDPAMRNTSASPPATATGCASISSSRHGSDLVCRTGAIGPLPIFLGATSEPLDEPEPLVPSVTTSDPVRLLTALPPHGDADKAETLVTTRFRHVLTEEGHAVIAGQNEVLERCEDEPIHTPGAVQGFGLLVVIQEAGQGCLQVRYASENSGRIIGYTPQQLFQLRSFLDILSEEQQGNLLDHIDFIRDEETDPGTNGPEVFSISIRNGRYRGDDAGGDRRDRRSIKFWCAIHVNRAHPDLVICEFEADDDKQYPLYPPSNVTSGDSMPPERAQTHTPADTLHANPTAAELIESTEMMSKPLRILRSARNRKGEAGAMQVFDIMLQVQEQLASAPNLNLFLKILVGIVKELTGFHRVMIYQFDASFNGKVVTELVDVAQTKDLYHGLHFPASDIPRQARDLYKVNKVRLLYDRDLETARLVCRSRADLELPLDLTHSYLRAMSPIHLKYLANMAVRSSMSISINTFNELWGLISCHSYGPRGMRVSFPIRKMCRLVGETASRNIERLSYASRLQARKLINTTPTDKNPSGYIIASSDDLLQLFDADCGLLSIQGETKILGKVEQSQEALAMLEYLRMRKLASVVTSQDIIEDFPDLRYPPGFRALAGMLYVPLSIGGNDFIVFFRHGQIKEVRWAGNPYEKIIRDGTAGYLEPRTSFRAWHETVLGKCRDWTEEQVETAAVLCLVYGKFIEVWRQKQAALQSSRLTRILLANSAHEVRTPLNAIINYLEIALEGSLDEETRGNLAKSHSASKSLIYVINDLLDLTKAEQGQSLIKDEVFDLSACIREATGPFKVDARLKDIAYNVVEHPGLPKYVHGDNRHVRQAISNITANAISHTSSGAVRVEAYATEVNERRVRIEFAIQDTGSGMSAQQLDAIFQDLEQVTSDSEEAASSPEALGKRRALGLGLAVVARVVRNMDGQLRLKSEEGKGSRFVIQLPFEVPEDSRPGSCGHSAGTADSTTSSVASVLTGMGTSPEGEITLVDRGSHYNSTMHGDSSEEHPPGLGRMNSRSSLQSKGSKGSVGSKGSGLSTRSDADQLINAIQTPLSLLVDDHAGAESTLPTSRRPLSLAYHAAAAGSQRSSPQHAHVNACVPPEGTQLRVRTVKLPDDDSLDSRARRIESYSQPSHMSHIAGIGDSIAPTNELEQGKVLERRDNSRELLRLQQRARMHGGDGNDLAENPGTLATNSLDTTSLEVLIAEDDPINMRLLRKRLEKAGHRVRAAVNGQDCATTYGEQSTTFDVVLMDMQMPIVDGLTSTTMIRALEKSPAHQGLSCLASNNGRVPIFAVSASLVEHEKAAYIEAGFDGWILKPIDFKRLNELLGGIIDDDFRDKCLYTAGHWEKGGWFCSRQESQLAAQT
jgi:light-regulated signal transduction histidine kinase (bacteriophytochrome)/AmiR/NasT family two-component response regulator